MNTLPGLTPVSLLPKIAQHAGLSFADLVERILAGAALDDVAMRDEPPAPPVHTHTRIAG